MQMNGGQESGISKLIGWTSKSVGGLVMIGAGSEVYGHTRGWAYRLLRETWDADIARWLTYFVGGLEWVLLFAVTALVLHVLLTWFLTWLISRGFGGGDGD